MKANTKHPKHNDIIARLDQGYEGESRNTRRITMAFTQRNKADTSIHFLAGTIKKVEVKIGSQWGMIEKITDQDLKISGMRDFWLYVYVEESAGQLILEFEIENSKDAYMWHRPDGFPRKQLFWGEKETFSYTTSA